MKHSRLKAQFKGFSDNGSQCKINLIQHTPDIIYQINISPADELCNDFEDTVDIHSYVDHINRKIQEMKDKIHGTHKFFDIKLYLDISMSNNMNVHFHGIVKIHDMLYFTFWLKRLYCHYYVDTIDDLDGRILYMEKYVKLINHEYGIIDKGILTNQPITNKKLIKKAETSTETPEIISFDCSRSEVHEKKSMVKRQRRIKISN